MKSVRSAFVLAAGKGERLKPYTLSTPKPLLEVQGAPLLDSVLENLKPLELERVVLNAWYLADQVEAYANSRKTKFPFEILVSREQALLGTGGGLKRALPLLKDGPLLMLNGDCFWKADIRLFVQQALDLKDCEGVWWMTSPQKDQTLVEWADSQKIVKIGGVWQSPTSYVATGAGCFTGIQIFQELHPESLPEKGSIVGDYWMNRFRENKSLKASRLRLEMWSDIGTVSRYEEVRNKT